MNLIKLTLLFVLATPYAVSQPFMITPIEGQQGEEWRIVNYVDWETEGFKDHNCGTKSYDGHQGTDFVLPSFAAMDDSVAVIAAASGRVTYTIDTLFDRETEGIISKELGNFIAIAHPNKYYTYYAHLMKGSAQVNAGDSVSAGDLLGYVGSSGNSTDPHLHFELWYDSLYPVDPFAGPCGNEASQFIDPAKYDESKGLYASGIHLAEYIDIKNLREREVTLERPYEMSPSSDSLLYFWAHLHGMKAGSTLKLVWTNAEGLIWFDFETTIEQDNWYYYYWSFINHTDLPLGLWNATLYYDDEPIAIETFEVKDSINSVETIQKGEDNPYKHLSLANLLQNPDIKVRITNISGQQIRINNHKSSLPTQGVYYITIIADEKIYSFSKMVY